MRTRIIASDKIVELIIIIRKGFNVSSSEKNCTYINHGGEVRYSLRALHPSAPLGI
jgi:hypothetical protein